MVTATLGGLIKDYRIKKRLSQLEVSLRIGWQDTSRLSKIEQGRVGKPIRETVDKIIKALDLNKQETGEFLLVGGYLPTDKEIRKAIKEIGPKIDNWPYPAYTIDFSWRSIRTNKINILIFNLPLSWVDFCNKMKPNVLGFPFLSPEQFPVKVEKGEDEKSLKPFKIAQIAAFKTENLKYQNESWYKKLVQEMMEFDDFRKLWPKVDQKMYHKKLFDYEYKRITGIYEGKRRSLNFHLLTAKLISDPRFQIVLYYPVDKTTEEYCAKLRRKISSLT